jgi:3'(2'), 5'-bisphosphate nucleotidase
MNDHSLAGQLARQAGQLLLEVRAEAQAEGVDDKELRSRGDNRSNDLILATLAKERPGDAILSEESKDDPSRLSASRVWIVDPLDGTREYAEGRDDWAVHIALVSGGQPIAGAVALPGMDKVLVTKPAPSVVGEMPSRPRLVVSRTRPPKIAKYLAEQLDAELVPMGSAGAKTMAIVLGQADVYAHAGGQYEWDSCAHVAVAAAAGLWTSRLDGSPLVYNNADPYLPDLLVARQEIQVKVRAAIATAPAGSFDTA